MHGEREVPDLLRRLLALSSEPSRTLQGLGAVAVEMFVGQFLLPIWDLRFLSFSHSLVISCATAEESWYSGGDRGTQTHLMTGSSASTEERLCVLWCRWVVSEQRRGGRFLFFHFSEQELYSTSAEMIR